MNLKFLVYIAFILSVTELSKSQQSECRDVDTKKFPACVKEGFNSTIVSLASEHYANAYSTIINDITAGLGDCSDFTNVILCSLYVPRCRTDMPNPWLPCREVCWEFVRGCGEKMDLLGLNWLKSLCSVLNTTTKNKINPDHCFVPPGFKPSLNSSQGLFCNETVQNEQCVNASCKNTFVPKKVQINKDFKDNENSTIYKLVNSVTNGTCKGILAKLACASYTPPCDKGGYRMKTLCRSDCVDLIHDCLEAFNNTEVAAYCAEPTEGNEDSGFCELKRWPSARHWDRGGPRDWRLPYSFPGGLIAALVLVPVLALVFIYIAIAVKRRYVQRKSGYVPQRSTYTEPGTEPGIEPENNPIA